MKNTSSNKSVKIRQRFIIESVLIFLIVLAPFIFMLHGYLSRDPEATLEIFGYVIDRNGFPNIRTYIWFLLGKIIPLYLLLIWFFTSKQWWYHIILIPILMYAFQTFEVLYSDDTKIDTDNIWWLLPVCMIVVPIVYLIRIKLYDRYVHGIDLEAMEAELHALKQKRLREQDIQTAKAELPKVDYRSLSEWLDQELSTAKLAQRFKRLKQSIVSFSLFKF